MPRLPHSKLSGPKVATAKVLPSCPASLSRLLSLQAFLLAFLLALVLPAAGVAQDTAAAKKTATTVQAGHSQPMYPVRQLSPELQVQQLAPGLWLHRTTQKLSNGAEFTSNGLLLDTGDGIWLLDTAWGYYPTLDLLHFVDAVLQKPVRKAIATHAHEDRTGGYRLLAERGIPLQVTAQTATLAAKAGIKSLQVVTDLAVGAHFQDGPVDWFYPGPGHTADNITLYLPQYQLLHGGCFVKAPRYPGLGNIADADVAAWPASLQRLKTAYPAAQIVVPGHGEPGDRALFDYSLGLFAPKQP